MLLLDRQGLYILLLYDPMVSTDGKLKRMCITSKTWVCSLFYSTLLYLIQLALLRYCQNSDPIRSPFHCKWGEQ